VHAKTTTTTAKFCQFPTIFNASPAAVYSLGLFTPVLDGGRRDDRSVFSPPPPGLTVFASRSLASAKTKNKIVVVATKETSSLIFSGLRIAAGVVNFASFYSFLSSQYHGAAVSKRRLVLGPPSLSYLRDDGCVCLPSVRGDGGAPAAFHRWLFLAVRAKVQGSVIEAEQGCFFSLRHFGHFLLSHFGHWNISVISLTVVLNLAITVFVSRYFQTFWPKRLNFFSVISKPFRSVAEKKQIQWRIRTRSLEGSVKWGATKNSSLV